MLYRLHPYLKACNTQKTRHRAMDSSRDVPARRRPSVAATRMEIGNDVNFGQLTRTLLESLSNSPGCSLHLHHEVADFQRGTMAHGA